MNRKNNTNKKPLIGISMRMSLPNRHLYLPAEYAEAIEWAGGVPVHLSLLPERDYLNNISDLIGGVVLPGGGDIDPLKYETEPKPGLGTVSPLRDENDLILLKLAEEKKLPVLGICYGMQLLNVFRGGGIIQDIEREKPGSLDHQQGEPRERRSHWITITENSLLFGGRKDRVLVNSHHHQAIERIGENLFVSAFASDGIVEAIEDSRPGRFNLGVQWHPEIGFRSDDLSKTIFEKFVAAAAQAN